MPVQDDERERELVRLFNLKWDPAHQRAGVDALLELQFEGGKRELEVEVKSTTGDTVSTARDVGMTHIEKWKHKFFIIGFYTKDQRRPELKRSLCLTPSDMAPWIASIESKILADFKLAKLASKRLVLADLHEVCGAKDTYSLADARNLHKQQWTSAQYESVQDVEVDGVRRISKANMLKLLQLRAAYIAERGATLNNPHITKAHLDQFLGTNREANTDQAARIRSIALEYLAGTRQRNN